jgi:hypothetical protein
MYNEVEQEKLTSERLLAMIPALYRANRDVRKQMEQLRRLLTWETFGNADLHFIRKEILSLLPKIESPQGRSNRAPKNLGA